MKRRVRRRRDSARPAISVTCVAAAVACRRRYGGDAGQRPRRRRRHQFLAARPVRQSRRRARGAGLGARSRQLLHSVSASGAVAAAREVTLGNFNGNVTVNLNATIKATPDLVFIAPSYTFATPVFGGQLALGITEAVGRSVADLDGTLTLPGRAAASSARQGVSTTAATDLAISTRWRR